MGNSSHFMSVAAAATVPCSNHEIYNVNLLQMITTGKEKWPWIQKGFQISPAKFLSVSPEAGAEFLPNEWGLLGNLHALGDLMKKSEPFLGSLLVFITYFTFDNTKHFTTALIYLRAFTSNLKTYLCSLFLIVNKSSYKFQRVSKRGSLELSRKEVAFPAP